MTDLDLCYISAHEALARFKARKLSPVELMQAVIARAEAVEPKINALCFTFFDQALEAARKAEARYAKGARTKPLEGLPVAIKDESYIAGQVTTNASLFLKDQVAETTSPVNDRILKAGGIVHARTTTPEFSCAGFCHSKLWGVTRNPWNRRYTPGGSSGGSGASLASGTATLASGSDIGGSIRIPASASGLVGFKPPYGRNPEETPFNLDFYCHVGPMARSVKDCILLQNEMAGPHPKDIASLRPKLRLPLDYKDIKGWRIAYSLDLGFFPLDADVRRNTLAALDAFRELGATVEEVDLGWTEEIGKAADDYLVHIFGTSMGVYLGRQAHKLTDYARQFAEAGRKSTAKRFYRSLEVAAGMYDSFGPMMEKYRIFICPTLALPALRADFDPTREKLTIARKPVNPFLGWAMTFPFNMLSRCPVLAMPSGQSKTGVPTGIQIVGRTYRDADVFQAAAAFEALDPWYGRPGRRPKL